MMASAGERPHIMCGPHDRPRDPPNTFGIKMAVIDPIQMNDVSIDPIDCVRRVPWQKGRRELQMAEILPPPRVSKSRQAFRQLGESVMAREKARIWHNAVIGCAWLQKQQAGFDALRHQGVHNPQNGYRGSALMMHTIYKKNFHGLVEGFRHNVAILSAGSTIRGFPMGAVLTELECSGKKAAE
jgi:hypothetical protein